MIAVKAPEGIGMVAPMMVKALQALSRRQGVDRATPGQTAGQRCRPPTRRPAPRGIRARIAAIFWSGCLLPHVEPFRISASSHIQSVTPHLS
jgi:hypothetical protein